MQPSHSVFLFCIYARDPVVCSKCSIAILACNVLIPCYCYCYLFLLFAPQYLYLHIVICTSITSVLMLNCNYFATMVFLLPYLPNLTTFAHTVYRFFLLCYWLYICLSYVLLFLSHCFALSWPGRSCKWELVLNWPTWLNKGEIKKCKVMIHSCV